MTNREQLENRLKKQEESLVQALVRLGVDENEAKTLAKKEIEKMGSTKTMRGDCPMGAFNPMACMFCIFGHMTECHYPHTCEDAECSHYRQEIEAEGYAYYPGEELP